MNRLSDAELGIMLALWEAGRPVPRKYLQEKLAHLGWKPTTFNTYITRMQAKGLLGSTAQGKGATYRYWPLVSQKEYADQVGQSVLGTLFGGSVKNLVLSLSGTRAVTEDDLEELRTLLNERKGGGGVGE